MDVLTGELDDEDDREAEIGAVSIVLLVDHIRRPARSLVLEAFRLWFGHDVTSIHTDPLPLGTRERILEALEHAEPILAAGRAAIYESDGVLKIVTPDSGILVVEHVPSPWYDDPTAVAAPLADARFARDVREHRAFLEIGLLGLDVVDDPDVSVRRLSGFATAFCEDPGVVGISVPDRELLAPNRPALLETLCGEDPFDWPGSAFDNYPDARALEGDQRGAFDRSAQEARRRWPEFAAAFAVVADEDPDEHTVSDTFTVKIGVYEQEVCENLWFWLRAIEGDEIVCTLESEPIYLVGIRRGDTRRFPVREVLDWVRQTAAGELFGGFTLRQG